MTAFPLARSWRSPRLWLVIALVVWYADPPGLWANLTRADPPSATLAVRTVQLLRLGNFRTIGVRESLQRSVGAVHSLPADMGSISPGQVFESVRVVFNERRSPGAIA